jgi:predicted nuclease of predicted toxin-antitoxin system
MAAASDKAIFERALAEDRVIVSADTDFGFLLSAEKAKKPSLILFRGSVTRVPEKQVGILLSNLGSVSRDLAAGAVVVFDEERVRVRLLPIG